RRRAQASTTAHGPVRPVRPPGGEGPAMKLVERLGRGPAAAVRAGGADEPQGHDIDVIVARLHDRIIDRRGMAQGARRDGGALAARCACGCRAWWPRGWPPSTSKFH